MRVQGIRIEIVILALLVALAGFFGAQYLIREYWIGQPLQEEILKIPGIIDVELMDSREGLLLQLELQPVSNILATYNQVQSIGEHLIKNEDFSIQFKNSDQELEAIYFQLHHHIYHSISRHDYVYLQDYLNREGRDRGLDEALFFLDDTHLYLQLVKGDAAYYRIIPRYKKEDLLR